MTASVIVVGHRMGAQVAERAAGARSDAVAVIVLLTLVRLGGIALPTEVATEMRGLDGNRAGQVQLRTQFATPLPEATLTRFLDVGMEGLGAGCSGTVRCLERGRSSRKRSHRLRRTCVDRRRAGRRVRDARLLTAVVVPRFPQAVVRYVPNAAHSPACRAARGVGRVAHDVPRHDRSKPGSKTTRRTVSC